jgi:ppx/gppA phosphatase family protein
MRYAVIDIGANTVRLQVYEVTNNVPVTLFTKKIVAGLVTYIEAGRLTEKGCQKLIKVLSTHLSTVELFAVKKTFVFATASLRDIDNADEVQQAVRAKLNTELLILAQEEEAKLGYIGIALSCNAEEGCTVDIGGGSTEIVLFKNKKASVYLNLDFGSLSLYKDNVTLVLPTSQEAKKINSFVKKRIEREAALSSKVIFGIGGTIRAIGNILSEFISGNSNTRFSYDDVILLHKELLAQNPKLFKTILQVVPERVHTITPGTIIVKNILEKFKSNEVVVCNTGLREGVLLSSI